MIDAVSSLAMLVAVRRMDAARWPQTEPVPRRPRALREGWAYVARTPALAVPLAMMALVGTLGFDFQVLLPLGRQIAFESGAGTYAGWCSAMAAARSPVPSPPARADAFRPGCSSAPAPPSAWRPYWWALAPTLTMAVIALALTGAASVPSRRG